MKPASEPSVSSAGAAAAARLRVLLLMPTSTYHAGDFVDAAARLDVAVTVGVNGSQALQEATPGSTLTLDFGDLDATTATILDFVRRFPVHAVVAADDEATMAAASIAAALDLPHNPPDAVLVTTSKRSLRDALARAGLAAPRYQVLDLKAGGGAPGGPVAQVPFPCVLKPTFLSASRGVIRADNEDEYRAAAERIGAILADPELQSMGGAEAGLILVEEYIPGEEYAVEAMLNGGKLHLLALFDKPDPLEGPYFEETIYVTPSRASNERQRAIVAAVEDAVGAIGLTEGPVHAELRVNHRGAFIIDLAPRAIGGLCPRVLRFGAGASLEELILRHAIGEDFASFDREDGAGGVMMIPIPEGGTLRRIDGADAARDTPGVTEVAMTINPGQRLVPLPEGNRYLGFIFARTETPAQAEQALRAAHARLSFEIES